MPRPRSSCRILREPLMQCFIPEKEGVENFEALRITLEEFEALRLRDIRKSSRKMQQRLWIFLSPPFTGPLAPPGGKFPGP